MIAPPETRPTTADEPLAPDDLLELRFVRDAQLSPDGRRAAAILSRADRPSDGEFFELVLIDTASGAHDPLVTADVHVAGPSWSPDGSKLAYIRLDGGPPRICIHDVATGGIAETAVEGGAPQPPLAWSPDGARLALTVTSVRPPAPGIHRITKLGYRVEGIGFVDQLSQRIDILEVASGAIACITEGLGNCSNPQFSPTGDRLMFGAIEGAARPGGGSAPLPHILHFADGLVTRPLGEDWHVTTTSWLPDGRRLLIFGAYRSTLAVPVSVLYTFDLDTGAFQLRTPDLQAQIGMRVHEDTPIWEISFTRGLEIIDDDHLFASVQAGGETQIWRIALSGPPNLEPVVTGNRACLLLGATADSLLFLASDAFRPGDLCLARLPSGEEQRLTALNDHVLAAWPQLAIRHLPVTSPDGLEFDAWCLAPKGEEGPLPTIMFIHGGPFLAVGHAFRYDFHMLASRGWGIVFANFRGSAGYGEAFQRKIIGDWAGRGFPDHMAVVDAAVASGLADPERLGVWGASHGGLATAWIVGHTSRFRAAVAEASVTNYATLYYLSDLGDGFARDLGGLPHEIPDMYRSRSPLTFAHRCTTPTLMLHGEEDYRCPIAEAEQFFRVLIDVGCTTELVRIPRCNHMGDAHGPLSARVGQNEALADWFERYL
ncbi:S9 family peptidase [Sphingosinicella rhizophila]|uniref:S9 family peptidase n=1 Tax=Sphingosinicella rhizophila TaxID=3050082 RepID=A0ABU3Q9T0_9SPHN|nr:S9 family peptidase [Sphingosinicella sp. GR2756]MDT9600072.1 S9 family peptidase [Sphingosinicella sp. GR2756]